MKKEQFEQILQPLGKFRKSTTGSWAADGHNDLVFVPTHPHQQCPDCDLMVRGRVILFERKVDRKDEVYWRTKCVDCKKKWEELRL